jgi:hypothetical protein
LATAAAFLLGDGGGVFQPAQRARGERVQLLARGSVYELTRLKAKA